MSTERPRPSGRARALLRRIGTVLTPREPATLDALADLADTMATSVAGLHAWATAAADVTTATATTDTTDPTDTTARAGSGGENGAYDDCMEALRSAMLAAGRGRRRIAGQVAEAFLLPFDPEELLEISERLEAVVAAAYVLRREADLLDADASPELARLLELADDLAATTAGAIRALRTDRRAAHAAAEDVLDRRWDAEDAYAAAILASFARPDPDQREAEAAGIDHGQSNGQSNRRRGRRAAHRDLARHAETLIELIARCARRVVHAVAKNS